MKELAVLLVLAFAMLIGIAACSGEDNGRIAEEDPGQVDEGNGQQYGRRGAVTYQVDEETSMTITVSPPPTLLVEPAEIAAALVDPDSINLGVWSLVYSLGIGVYEPDGTVVLQGAETGVDDFWLYDLQIPQLANAAYTPSSFSQFYELVATVFDLSYPWGGGEMDMATMRSLYWAEYQALDQDLPDDPSFLAVLFAGMGLDLGWSNPDPELTRLQEILLLLDGFTDSGASEVQSIRSGHLQMSRSDGYAWWCERNPGACRDPEPDQEKYDICITRSQDAAVAAKFGRAIVLKLLKIGLDKYKSPFDLVDAMMMDSDIKRSVHVLPSTTHVKECPSSSPTVIAHATISILGDSDVAKTIAECGRQAGAIPGAGATLSLFDGSVPIPSVPTFWTLSGPGVSRVETIRKDTKTDMSGRAEMELAPRTTNECEGDLLKDEVIVSAQFSTEALVIALRGAGWTDLLAAMVTSVTQGRHEHSFVVQYRLDKDNPDHPGYTSQFGDTWTVPRVYRAGDSLGW